MRLDLESGLTLRQRLKARLVKWIMRSDHVPGPIVTMSYDPELFGNHFAEALEDGMRRMKHWSLGEVELFAAFVSKENRCAY